MALTAGSSPELLQILKACAACVDAVSLPEPSFALRLAWSRTYDDLLSSDSADVTEFGGALDRAFDSGRAMVVGAGGTGKSVALKRMAKTAVANSVVTISVDLKIWRSADYEAWASASRAGFVGQLDFLLERYACPAVTSVELDLLPPEVRKLLVIDGLSEVRGTVGAEIIQVANDFSRAVINSAVIVADRLIRRELPDARRWHLGRVLPVDVTALDAASMHALNADGQIKGSFLERHSDLRTAYFVDLFLRQDHFNGSSSSMRDVFIATAGISEQDLVRVACASLELFDDRGARSFAANELREKVGEPLFESLTKSSLLSVDDINRSHFVHHLWHDFLAAYCVAHEKAHWTWEKLQRLTLGASSFDSISFVLELLPNENDADQFVRLVYDWNPYAAGYSIAQARARGGTSVSQPMEFIMLAVLAEKRFDLIEATARRATDGLRVANSPEAKTFLDVRNLEQVLDIARAANYEPAWFKDWQAVFCAPIGSPATDRMYESLCTTDSLIGWTTANVVKRLSASENQLILLTTYLGHASYAVRWRACHALGAFPSGDVVAAVSRLLGDPNEWVRFGATRALVELAARGSGEVRGRVGSVLLAGLPSMDLRSRQELRRTLVLNGPNIPEDWIQAAGPLLEELYETAETAVEKSEIEYVLLELQRRERMHA